MTAAPVGESDGGGESQFPGDPLAWLAGLKQGAGARQAALVDLSIEPFTLIPP